MRLMKRIFTCLLCVLLLAGCGADRSGEGNYMASVPEQLGLDLNAKSTVREESTELALSTEWAEYDPSVGAIWFTLENHSGAEIETGADYALERYVEEAGDWYQIPVKDNVGWNAVAFCVPDGEAIALSCALSVFDYDFFAGGRFRIVKTAEGQTCTAEFQLTPGAAVSAETPYGFGPLEDLPADYSAGTAADTDVVFTMDGVENSALAEKFLSKLSLGVPCQLRTVQDYGEGAVMVIDVICENDHFLWRMLQNGTVTEQRFSYLVTDGADVYLSNGADWENTAVRRSEKAFLLPEGTAAGLVPAVEGMTENRLAWNSTRYRVWSADGVWSASLTETPTEFSVGWQRPGEGSWGSLYDIQSWDGLETAILKLEWREDGRLRLTCETLDGGTSVLFYDPETEALTGK